LSKIRMAPLSRHKLEKLDFFVKYLYEDNVEY
jgi:hypothetical protein